MLPVTPFEYSEEQEVYDHIGRLRKGQNPFIDWLGGSVIHIQSKQNNWKKVLNKLKYLFRN